MARRWCWVDPIVEGIVALLCAIGAATLIGMFFGWLLRPAQWNGMRAVLPGRGDGEGLEAAVQWLSWLRKAGLFQGEVVLWDVGLTPRGREVALRLSLNRPWVTCCPQGALEEWLTL